MPESSAARVEDVEAIAIRMTERVIAEVTAHLSAKIDREVAVQDQRLDELAATVRVAAATVTKMVADLAEERPRPPRPGAPIPRPKALDDACGAAAQDDSPRSVQVEVYGRTVTQYVAPGTDPAQVWDELCATISDRARAVAWHN